MRFELRTIRCSRIFYAVGAVTSFDGEAAPLLRARYDEVALGLGAYGIRLPPKDAVALCMTVDPEVTKGGRVSTCAVHEPPWHHV